VRLSQVTPRGEKEEGTRRGRDTLDASMFDEVTCKCVCEISTCRISFHDDILRRKSDVIHEIIVARQRIQQCRWEGISRVGGANGESIFDRKYAMYGVAIFEETTGDICRGICRVCG
jgi:hypothetical protein